MLAVNDDGDEEKHIERNSHVKVNVSEGKGVPAIKDFLVLTIYTKLSNKWHVCNKGKQVWKDDIDEGNYRVELRMIYFDNYYILGC